MCFMAGWIKLKALGKVNTQRLLVKAGDVFLDWNDWVEPQAWQYEHNILHHYYTNENLDPDRVTNSIHFNWIKSKWLRFFIFLPQLMLWKASYYAVNTQKALAEKNNIVTKVINTVTSIKLF